MAIETSVSMLRGESRLIRVTMTANGSIGDWTLAFALRRDRNEPDSVQPLYTHDSDEIAVEIEDPGAADAPGVIDIIIARAAGLALSRTGGGRTGYWWGLKRADEGLEAVIAHGQLTVSETAPR